MLIRKEQCMLKSIAATQQECILNKYWCLQNNGNLIHWHLIFQFKCVKKISICGPVTPRESSFPPFKMCLIKNKEIILLPSSNQRSETLREYAFLTIETLGR